MSAPDGGRRATPVAWTLAAAWAVVYAASLLLSEGDRGAGSVWTWGAPDGSLLLRLGALVPALVREGDVARLLAHAFLHASAIHVLFNVWVWLWAGRALERVAGSSRTLVVLVLSILAGATAHVLLRDGWAVGASGGVLGAVGALGVWSLRARHPEAAAIRGSVIVFLALTVAMAFVVPRVAHEAHAGGFATGVLAMALFGPRRSAASPGARVRALAVLLGVGTAIALGAQGVRALQSPERAEALALWEQVRGIDRLGHELWDDPMRATPAERQRLGRLVAALRADDALGDWPGRGALEIWLDAWDPVVRGDIPDPFAVQRDLRQAEERWAPWRARLARLAGRRR